MSSDDVGGIIRQSYVIRDDLDMAVPVVPSQTEFRLADNTAINIDEQDVITVFYDETGYASGAAEGFTTEIGLKPISSKKGIAIFVQPFVVTDALERSIPIRPDQTEINLLGSDFYPIQREEVVEVFYGEKGQAIFHRFRDCEVRPGPVVASGQNGVGIWSVAHQVFPDDTASVIASKTLLQYVGQDNVHTVLFDCYGKAVCLRLPNGDIVPGGLKKRGGVNKVEFYYSPSAASKGVPSAQRIQQIVGNHVELMNGKRLEVHPDEISVVLLDAKSRDLGVLMSNRRPSYVPGPASSALPGLDRAEIPPQDRFPVSRSKHSMKKHQVLSTESSSDSDEDDDYTSQSTLSNDTMSFQQPMASPSRPLKNRLPMGNQSDRKHHENSLMPFGVHYKSQLYVEDMGTFIPLKSATSKVKLSSSHSKVSVKRSAVIRAEYDKRGLLVRAVDSLGSPTYWPFNKPGMAIKVQDYLIHDSLLYAVPVTYGQTEIEVSDGSRLKIDSESIVTVYYRDDGEIGFFWQNGKLTMGRFDHPGVAKRVDLMYALDCSDNSDDTFVIPLKSPFKSVLDPNDPKKKRTVVVDPQEVYVIMHDADGTPLYFQLCDGTLMAGGLEKLGDPVEGTNDGGKTRHGGSHHARNVGYERRRLGNQSACSRRHLSSQSAASVTSSLRAQAKVGSSGPMESDGSRVAGSSRMASFASGTIGSSNPFTMRSQSSSTRRREVIERRVPVEQIQVVEKIVEVPEIRIVEKLVEVEKIEYEVKYVKKKEIVERPVEHITYIPKIEKKIIERCINVPEIVEVPREEKIEVKVPVDHFVDTKQEVIVEQKLTPLVADATEITEEVECLELQPVVIPVVLYVPKLVRGMMVACGTVKEEKTEVKDLSIGHFNSLLMKLNSTTMNSYEKLPVMKTESGSIPMLSKNVALDIQPTSDEAVAQLLQEAGLVKRFATEEEKQQQPLMMSLGDTEDKENAEADMWKHFTPPKTTSLV